jgi:hypothetical protein
VSEQDLSFSVHNSSLRRCALTDPSGASTRGRPRGLGADANYFYFGLVAGSTNTTLYKAPLDGGAAAEASATIDAKYSNFEPTANRFIFVTPAGELKSVAKTGGATSEHA